MLVGALAFRDETGGSSLSLRGADLPDHPRCRTVDRRNIAVSGLGQSLALARFGSNPESESDGNEDWSIAADSAAYRLNQWR